MSHLSDLIDLPSKAPTLTTTVDMAGAIVTVGYDYDEDDCPPFFATDVLINGVWMDPYSVFADRITRAINWQITDAMQAKFEQVAA